MEGLDVPDVSTMFDRLSIECNQMIAHFIVDDSDLKNFSLACKQTANAVYSDNLSFWHRRFHNVFEPVALQLKNTQYKRLYEYRKDLLDGSVKFKRGTSGSEQQCLAVLYALIRESWSSPLIDTRSGLKYSRNLDVFEAFVEKNSALIRPSRDNAETARRPFSTSLLVIQIMAAPFLLRQTHGKYALPYTYPQAQYAAYQSMQTCMIFDTESYAIDMNWLVRNLHFWQYHMTREQEYTLYHSFNSLSPEEKPRFWDRPLATTVCLGEQWKGSYAFLSSADVSHVRAGLGSNRMIQDQFNTEAGSFQDMKITIMGNDVDDPGVKENWPDFFENLLLSLGYLETPKDTSPTQDEATSSQSTPNVNFTAEGKDTNDTFLAAGWVNPLPSQNRLPGWQRMTMMKYNNDENGEIDRDTMWAYEGVMLPGGKIIIGRWWNPNTPLTDAGMYSGPFIFWCIDPACDSDQKLGESRAALVEEG